MSISAKDVKELREKTGCGMMDCKKALTEAGGDIEKAAEILREKGLASAVKKAGRIAAGIGVLFCQNFAGVVINQDVGFRVDLRNARDHGLDVQVVRVSCGERSSAKGRGQRHALHKTSRKSGLHGQNYDIRDGIKKSALL